MRRKLLFTMLAVGVVSFGFCSYFTERQLFKFVKAYYASHSVYKPLPKERAKELKSFVILIAAHNHQQEIEKNLRSVFDQDYNHYRIVFIDNGSQDRTYYRANELIKRSNKAEATTFIRNHERKPFLELLYFTIQEMKNDEIVVFLDAKDYLSHDHVLSELNRYYNDEHVWLTYAQYTNYPDYEKGEARSSLLQTKKPVALRSLPWIYSHYCTFYAGLFKKIKMKDLLYEGSFFQHINHRAILMPMFEMAEDHAVFVPEVLYVNNRERVEERTEEEIQLIKNYSRYVRSLPSYHRLKEHPSNDFLQVDEADLFVFSYDRPMQLYSFLESQRKYTENLTDVYVIYSTSDLKYEQGYDLIKRSFPEVYFMKQKPQRGEFKKNLIAMIKKASSPYVAIAEDQLLLKDRLEIDRAILLLEKTGAFGFYFSLGMNLYNRPQHYFAIAPDSIGWQFKEGEKEWSRSYSLGFSLYRKKDLADALSRLHFSSLEELKEEFREANDHTELGLCFTESRSVIPLFEIFRGRKGGKEVIYSLEELNQLFLEGMKLDIRSIHRQRNREIGITTIPGFVSR